MATMQTRIQQASAKNAELLRVLAETGHAVPDLLSQQRFVDDLTAELDASRGRIEALERRRTRELRDHEKYRDSVMRRFAHKATGQAGKFAAKAEKEEHEYFAALQDLHREQEMAANLAAQLDEAGRVRAGLKEMADRHAACQAELDRLYDAVFAGPTPEFPDEDAKELANEVALRMYSEARIRAEAQLRAARMLKQAALTLHGAMLAMSEAQGHSTADMFGGGTLSDMMERNALSKAQTLVMEARQQIEMAQREDPQIMALKDININTGDIMRDVFFDNIFTDMAFHDEIKRGRAEVERAGKAVNVSVERATARYSELEQELKDQEGELQSTRFALQKAREEAFERVLASKESASE
jgi:hypothetical protein